MKFPLFVATLAFVVHSAVCHEDDEEEIQREEDALPDYLKDDGIRRVARLTKDHFNKTLRSSRMMVVLFYYAGKETPDADKTWKSDEQMLEVGYERSFIQILSWFDLASGVTADMPGYL